MSGVILLSKFLLEMQSGYFEAFKDYFDEIEWLASDEENRLEIYTVKKNGEDFGFKTLEYEIRYDDIQKPHISSIRIKGDE